METTQRDSNSEVISILFPDVLRRIWKEDKERNWNCYFKEMQFSYFWDNRNTVDRSK